jgi:hypothetical protein
MGGVYGLEIDTENHTELLRWWHQYQAKMLNQETDLIRNGLLQEMFALRRRLEVAGEAQPDEAANPGCDVYLTELKRLYALLENLCDRLESPFVQDSLPWALQHAVQPWQAPLALKVMLPSTWEPEPVEQTRLLILLVQRWLQQLAEAPSLPEHCELKLEHTAPVKQLVLKVDYPQSVPSTFVVPLLGGLTPFIKTFQLFTQGEYHQEVHAHSLALILCWKPETPSLI